MRLDGPSTRAVMPAAKRWRPVFAHLDALTDGRGLAGRLRHPSPEPAGYLLEDAAYGLVVTCREPQADPVIERLERCYLSFVVEALRADGTFRSGKTADGLWSDEPGADSWGRAVWALGVAASDAHSPGRRGRALAAFRIAAGQRPSAPHAMSFAGIGAGAVLRSRPAEPAARSLLRDASTGAGLDVAALERPDSRLGPADGARAEVLLVAGDLWRDKTVRTRGLDLLAFLLRTETRDGRPSLGPAGGGRLAGSHQPGAVAALADACGTAYRLTGDPRWLTGINLAWRWFLGENDGGVPMFDATTGAGYDELAARGAPQGPSAASTLAMLATAQHARRVHDLR